ncbi:MAG: Hpt domain-containing protein, partial [Rubrivivax sp.]
PLDALDALDAIDAMQRAEQSASPTSGAVGAGAPSSAFGPPIVSRLAHHPRLSKVARTFCATLPQKLAAMEHALANRQMDDLADLAHWLKGAGGTVGYDEFFEPAKQLEGHARAGRIPELRQTLQTIQSLAARVQPPPERAAAPVEA